MDGGDVGPQGWGHQGHFYCRDCLRQGHPRFAPEIVDGTTCANCGRRWHSGAWRSISVMDQMHNAIVATEGGGMWDDKAKKFIEVDEDQAAKADPEVVFRVGEIVEVKGLRFDVDQVRGNRLTLRPLGPRLVKT